MDSSFELNNLSFDGQSNHNKSDLAQNSDDVDTNNSTDQSIHNIEVSRPNFDEFNSIINKTDKKSYKSPKSKKIYKQFTIRQVANIDGLDTSNMIHRGHKRGKNSVNDVGFIDDEGSTNRRFCNRCDIKNTPHSFSMDSSTTTLFNHLKIKHGYEGEGGGIAARPLTVNNERTLNWVVPQYFLRGGLGQSHGLSPGFEFLIQSIYPDYTPQGPTTIKRRYIEIYKMLKIMLIELLLSQKVLFSLCFDGWANYSKTHFTGYTLHWSDKETKSPQSAILAFETSTPGEGAGSRCAVKTKSILDDFQITDRMIAFVTDNGSKDNKAAEELINKHNSGCLNLSSLKTIYHQQCFSHSTQLPVKEATKYLDIICVKLRTALLDLGRSGTLRYYFRLASQEEFSRLLEPPKTDIEIRWNSFFIMISQCLKFRPVFKSLSELKSFSNIKDNLPCERGWKIINKLKDFLSKPADLTDRLGSESKPTINNVIAGYELLFNNAISYGGVVLLKEEFNELRVKSKTYNQSKQLSISKLSNTHQSQYKSFTNENEDDNVDAHEEENEELTQWCSQISNTPSNFDGDQTSFILGSTFNPSQIEQNCIKRPTLEEGQDEQILKDVSSLYLYKLNEKISRYNNDLTVMARFLDPTYHPDIRATPQAIHLIRTMLLNKRYEIPDSNPTNKVPYKLLNNDIYYEEGIDDILSQFKASPKKLDQASTYINSIDNEIAEYRGGATVTIVNINQLSWWYNRKHQFPRLYKLAFDILSIPATSTPVERANSLAASVYENRAMLSDYMFQLEVCCKSWYALFDKLNINIPNDPTDYLQRHKAQLNKYFIKDPVITRHKRDTETDHLSGINKS